jgi:hypothetical protein
LRQRIIAAVATENRDVLDGESLDRNGLSDWRVPCDTGFPDWVFVR